MRLEFMICQIQILNLLQTIQTSKLSKQGIWILITQTLPSKHTIKIHIYEPNRENQWEILTLIHYLNNIKIIIHHYKIHSANSTTSLQKKKKKKSAQHIEILL